MKSHLKNILLLLLFCTACTNPPYRGKDALGPDEFVMDSYKIREGKFAILEMEGKIYEPISPELLNEYEDVVHESDVLSITLYHPSRQDIVQSVQMINGNIGFQVMKGSITLPDVGCVEVASLTLDQAKKAIELHYAKHIHNIEVFLTYRDRKERKVELAGLVSTPTIPIDGRLRLFEVLALARVPPEANFFKSYVVHDSHIIPVDLYKLMKEGDMSQNIVMRAGDKVYIAEASASCVMVLGEVGKERVINVPRGFITLREALAAAGGIPYTGDRRHIQVIRGSILHPKIYTLNWQHVIHLPSNSLLLMPGDIVYVAATPIAEWNRFVNQFLPALIGFDLITKGIKSVGVNID